MTVELASLVAGRWLSGTRPEVDDLNPARPDEVIARFRPLDEQGLAAAADAAGNTAREWAATPFHDRAAVLARAASLLDARADELGRELTVEEGKTLREGVAEVRRAARIFTYYAGEADRDVGSLFASPRPGEHILTRQVPVGAVLLITPWNFPIAIPAWKLAPALVFGNTVVWKPSPVVPLLAVRLTEALLDAGLPPGVINLVLGGADAATFLLRHTSIAACSFTGSTPAGRAVLAEGAASGIKVQAEMGGANVAVVLSDADIDVAADCIVTGAMGSSGQKCTATSTVVVHERVADALTNAVIDRCDKLVVGDPLAASTDLGPVATAAQLDQISTAIDAASPLARVVRNGLEVERPAGGWFAGPTVAVNVARGHPLTREEVFGPVLAITPATSTADALRVANASRYGLTASVFTADLGRALTAIDDLDVGIVHVNSETTGADPHVPFGGIKASGAGGREMGRAARDFYTETRTVYVAAPSSSKDVR